MILRRFSLGLLTTVAAGALATAALADPPGRVGRVADIEGGVSMLPPGSEDWTWAARNYPVAPGESFWTGDDGRTRLQIGSADARLDSQTELDVLNLDYGAMRLALPQGSVELRLWASPRGGVTFATPAGDLHLDGQGLYRIDVGAPPADGSYPLVEVTVFEGQAEAPSPEGPVSIYAGQAAVVYAGYDPELQDPQDAGIDDWGRDLEIRNPWRPADQAAAALTGLGDLDGAGDYAQDPQYGRVWFPRDVPADWAPYRYGHWAYVEPWGYTWIDDQPWGFAPFHYGRWAQFGGRWGWIPGQPAAEPVYAPALVAFIGGVGWSLGGADAIGWAPLAPDEVYRPGYAVSADYVRRLNVTSVRATIINTTIINNTVVVAPAVYRNAGAATVVRAAAFSGAQPVRRALIPVTAEIIARAPPASQASRPPPQAAARTGFDRPGGGGPGGGVRAGPVAPVRPPAVLRATHAAVAAPPMQGGRPPVIAGARPVPPPPRPGPGAPAAAMIAPAQARRPPPAGAPPTAPRPIAPAAAPARPAPAYAPPIGAGPRPGSPPTPGAAPMAPRPAAGHETPPAEAPRTLTPPPARPPAPPAYAPAAARQAAPEPGRTPPPSAPSSAPRSAPPPAVRPPPPAMAPPPRPPQPRPEAEPPPRPPQPRPEAAPPPRPAPPRPEAGPPPPAKAKPGPEAKPREDGRRPPQP